MKLIILDNSGVINFSSSTFIKTPDEWKPIPGSLAALARLSQAGYRVVIATNQSGIGRGLMDMETFNTINEKMYKAVSQTGGHIDAIFFCPHAKADKRNCCKPKIEMYGEIIQRYGVDLKSIPIIGDSLRDMQAAAKAGALPILVLTGKGAITKTKHTLPDSTKIFDNLAGVVDSLIGKA